jgi:hypothetical protein
MLENHPTTARQDHGHQPGTDVWRTRDRQARNIRVHGHVSNREWVIVEAWHVEDIAGVLGQLGLLPS